jgi:L-alanine-DL-glutamate epimerase-like enolase superfamily enzyme
VDDYPGGRRPSSVVCISGAGHRGFGENVAFTQAEHDRFAARATDLLSDLLARAGGNRAAGGGGGRVGTLLRPDLPPYERAALEAALIDLGMRQAGLSFADLTGLREAPIRFVVSFSATSDPSEYVRRLRAAGFSGGLKIDVDPSWDEATRAALAKQAGISILDFKGRGDVGLAHEWAALLPDVILEDPPPGAGRGRIARDGPLSDARAVAAALALGEAVNLKAPRMGGPLEVLRSLALAAPVRGASAATGGDGATGTRARIPAYLGGMFEVGPGRAQARQLAALFCRDSPNDLAPVTGSWTARSGSSVLSIRLDTRGFGDGDSADISAAEHAR